MCLVFAPFPAPTPALLAALKIAAATISPTFPAATDTRDETISSFNHDGVSTSSAFDNVVASISEEINALTASLLSRQSTTTISDDKTNKTANLDDVVVMETGVDINSVATPVMDSFKPTVIRTSALLMNKRVATLESMDTRAATESFSGSELNTFIESEGDQESNLSNVALSERSDSIHETSDGKAAAVSYVIIHAVTKVGSFVMTAAMSLLKYCSQFFSCCPPVAEANANQVGTMGGSLDSVFKEGNGHEDRDVESETDIPLVEGLAVCDRLDALLAEAVACQLGFIEQLKQLQCGEWNPEGQ